MNPMNNQRIIDLIPDEHLEGPRFIQKTTYMQFSNGPKPEYKPQDRGVSAIEPIPNSNQVNTHPRTRKKGPEYRTGLRKSNSTLHLKHCSSLIELSRSKGGHAHGGYKWPKYKFFSNGACDIDTFDCLHPPRVPSSIYPIGLMSRKRAPLVHRSSSTNTDSDIKSVCRSLSLSKDQDEINSLLVRLFQHTRIDSQESLVVPIMKLLVSKLPTTSPDERIFNGLISFLSSLDHLPTESFRYLVSLVRWLVRWNSTGTRIPWPSQSPTLLFIELCCWNCSRGSPKDNQVAISNDIRNLDGGHMKEYISFAIPFITPTSQFSFSNDSIMQLLHAFAWKIPGNSFNELQHYLNNIISAGQKSFQITNDIFNIRARCVLRLQIFLHTRWIARIVDILKTADGSSFYNQMMEISHRLVPKLPHPEESIGDQIDESKINRHIMSDATFHAMTSRPLNPIEQLVLGSNLLHFQKWTNFGGGEFHVAGLLAPLISEEPLKLTESMMPNSTEIKKIFLIIFAAKTVADAFGAIRYIPGQLWVLERMLGVCRNVPEIGSVVADVIEGKMREIYYGSKTRICDKRIEELIGEREVMNIAESNCHLTDSNRPLQHLKALKKFVEDQFYYRHDENGNEMENHFLRLKKYLDGHENLPRQMTASQRRSETSSRSRVTFSITSGNLCLEISTNQLIFSETICDNFSWDNCIGPLIVRLENLMEENKETVKSAVDHGEFWEGRKNIDDRLGKLLEEMEICFFDRNKEGKNFLRQLADDSLNIVDLIVPDILLALPLESIPCMYGGTFVRIVDSLSGWAELPTKYDQKLRCEYVVNPGADCRGTEETIVPLLKKHGWEGSSGFAAGSLTDEQFTDKLKSSDIFLYSGHGGGEKHWSGSCIQRMRYKEGLGVAILMGCSSVKPYGDYAAPFCTPFHYLIGGYRLVAGTLWDVLGRELDRMTSQFVDDLSCGSKNNFSHSDIVRLISRCRKRAKLKFLTSASIVMYGIN